jgi:hypothetical protein
LFIQTKNNLNKRFLRNTDKYSAVFTEYSVAEYSAGHYSAEYLADRIVGHSLLQQNFCKVPQFEKKFKVSSNFSMVLSGTLMEMVTVKTVTAGGPKWNRLL